jgi:RsiW-degrading membrane proteinase PrsW (M82 family)
MKTFYFFWIAFAIVLGLGNVLLNFAVAVGFLFPPLFVLGAALPVLSVLALASSRLGAPVTWRQAVLALVAGSTLSVFVALVLEGILPFLVFVLLPPLSLLGGLSREAMTANQPDIIARLFYSPLLIVFLLFTALQAPLPEEFAKALGLPLFGRERIVNARQALMIGLAFGAGFAILENMLYEGIYARMSGASWGGITLLRGLGAVLHPICTAVVALGWFRARERGWGELLQAYAAAVGLHTLWNGGFAAFLFVSGLGYYREAELSLNLYGTGVQILLVVFLAVLALALWWLLYRLMNSLGQGMEPRLAPTIVSAPTDPRSPWGPDIGARRALAAWAIACALVIVPIGAALGLAWRSIQKVILP